MNRPQLTIPATCQRNQRFIAGAAVCVMAAALAAFAVEVIQLNGAVSCGAFVAEDGGQVGITPSVVNANAQTLILVSILTAVVEELVFRGVLLRALLGRLSVRGTIVATSVIFAVLHMLPIGASAEAISSVGLAVLSLVL